MKYPDLVITDTPPEVPPVVPPLHPQLEAPDSVTPTTPDSNRYAFYLLSHHAKDINPTLYISYPTRYSQTYKNQNITNIIKTKTINPTLYIFYPTS